MGDLANVLRMRGTWAATMWRGPLRSAPPFATPATSELCLVFANWTVYPTSAFDAGLIVSAIVSIDAI